MIWYNRLQKRGDYQSAQSVIVLGRGERAFANGAAAVYDHMSEISKKNGNHRTTFGTKVLTYIVIVGGEVKWQDISLPIEYAQGPPKYNCFSVFSKKHKQEEPPPADPGDITYQ